MSDDRQKDDDSFIQEARATQRRLRISGDDEKAASLGRAIARLSDLEENITVQERRLTALKDLQKLDECGVLAPFEDRGQIIKQRAATPLGFTRFTPAERLRHLLGVGRRAWQHIPSPRISDKDVTAYVEQWIGSTLDDVEDETGAPRDMQLRDRATRVWSALRWAGCGGNQFVITPDLAASLALTEVPEIAPDEAPLPYEVFVLSLPPGVVPFFLPGENGEVRQEWADTIKIETSSRSDKTKPLEFLWVINWGPLEIRRVMTADFSWRDLGAYADDEALVPHDEVALNASRGLVRNFLMWLHAEGGVKAHKPEAVPLKLAEKRKRGGESWPRQWVFGKEVKIAPELRRAAAEAALGRSHSEIPGWKVRARFTVRGHWRNQVHGPGRALRRRQWIAPFWKGPSERETWAHIYKPVVEVRR